MARISLGICLMLVVASSVIYEAQGTFLLKLYLKKNFPRKCNEFTPFANKGMITFVTNLEGNCPANAEFKNFFTQFKSYMSFIETASASSKNVDAEMTTKCDGLFKAMSALSSGKGAKSAEAGGLKATMLSMGKTLVEQKKNTKIMTLKQKKELIIAMVKWTKMLATFVKSASEQKGKSIDIASYGLDVDVNDKSIVGGTASSESTETSSSSTKTGAVSASGSVSSKTKESNGGTVSSKTKESSGGSSGGAFKDTTGKKSASPSGSPMASPSGSASVGGKTSSKGSASATGAASATKAASATGGASAKESGNAKESANAAGSVSGKSSFSTNKATKTSSESQTKTSSQSSFNSSSTTSVKQVETETSKEVMSFIMELEKKYSSKAELKVFFEKLKASMQASSSIASKTSKDYVSATTAATGKLTEAMALVGSRNVKSAKMKSNMETSKDEMIKCLKQLQDINSKIVSGKKVTSTQQSEIKQTITKWEKITTQFVETAASSSSSSSSSSSASQQQGNARMVKIE